MKPKKVAGLSEIIADMLYVNGKVQISVMTKFCQRVVAGKAMSDKWQTSELVPIF